MEDQSIRCSALLHWQLHPTFLVIALSGRSLFWLESPIHTFERGKRGRLSFYPVNASGDFIMLACESLRL